MRIDIAATIAVARGSAEQARNVVGTSGTGQALIEARENARHTVENVWAGMKDFDPYLKFSSAEDERAYRDREAARLAQIEKEKAKNTPEGDLNAVRLTKQQLGDAGQHGADRSPDYASRLSALDDAENQLQPAMQANRSTEKKSAPSPNHSDDLAAAMAAFADAGVKGPPSDNPTIDHGLQSDTSSTRTLGR